MKLNILFTSVGRRGYLIHYFREELKGRGLIHAANSEINVPGVIPADRKVQTPLINDERYIPFLLDYCKKNQINALISLFDIDLRKLSRHKKQFKEAGVELIVSEPEVIEICNDKWRLQNFLINEDFPVKSAFLSIEDARNALSKGVVKYPLMVKPRWGMGSIGVGYAENDEELQLLYNYVKFRIIHSYLSYQTVDTEHSVIIQEKCLGSEYNLDVINNLKAEYQTTVSKRKIRMRCGETDCAVTVNHNVLNKAGIDISTKLKHVGNLDADLFLENDVPYIIDLNARFGGGYPFSHIAGVNLPAAILSWLEGDMDTANYFKIRYGVEGQKDIVIIKV